MKPIYVKPSICIGFNKWNDKEGPKFKVGDNVGISKYKNICTTWSEEVFVNKKISDFKDKESFGTFSEKESPKIN